MRKIKTIDRPSLTVYDLNSTISLGFSLFLRRIA